MKKRDPAKDPVTRGRGHVFVRADGGLALGLGHIVRCLSLASALRSRGARVTFITRTTEKSVLAKITSAGCSVSRLPPLRDPQSEARLVTRRAHALGATAIVADSYALTEAYHRTLKNSGLPLLAISDFPERRRWADIVINPNLGVRSGDYSTRPGARLLLGPRYALLRADFAEARRRSTRRSGEPRIIVLMGGSDPGGLTLKTIAALQEVQMSFSVDVVAGGAYRGLSKLAAACRKAAHPTVLHHDPREIADLMRRATIAVSGAGSTCWELACLGIPAILLVLADNQKLVASGLQRAGCARSLGTAKPFPAQPLSRRVAALLQDGRLRGRMSTIGRGLVDGAGAGRVADVLIGWRT